MWALTELPAYFLSNSTRKILAIFAGESEVGGKKDFPKNATTVTIPAGSSFGRVLPVSIPINVDTINEAAEGFLILVETSEETSAMAEAPIINYARDGLAIGLIADDDG